MKKNLFGAVSAALALALAITSFGCESGNDNPVRVATDADRAALDKAVFKYVVNPTHYTPAATGTETPTGSGTGPYDWVSFKDGVNKFKRTDATTRSAEVKGTEVNDVVRTEKETITLNTDGTWTLSKESSDTEVFKLVVFGTAAASTYENRRVVPVEIVANGSATTSPAFAVGGFAANGTVTNITNGYYVKAASNESTDQARQTIVKNLNAALKTASDNLDAYKVANYGYVTKAVQDAYDAYVKSVKDAIADIDAWYQFEANKVIVTTTNTDGASKTVRKYFKGDDAIARATVETSSGTAKPEKGTYKLLDGNYSTGTILVTGEGTIAFDDDNDKFTDSSNGYVGKISVEYPDQTTVAALNNAYPASVKRKAGRKLSIVNGQLSAPKMDLSCTDAAGTHTFGFYLSAGYNKYLDNSVAGYPATASENYVSYVYQLQQK